MKLSGASRILSGRYDCRLHPHANEYQGDKLVANCFGEPHPAARTPKGYRSLAIRPHFMVYWLLIVWLSGMENFLGNNKRSIHRFQEGPVDGILETDIMIHRIGCIYEYSIPPEIGAVTTSRQPSR